MIRIFSNGIRRIPYLDAFIREERERFAGTACEAVIGWGHKPTAEKARAFAAEQHLPYIALEDGFLRSLGLGVSGAAPLSMTVDPVGVYYDATCPSALETDIAHSDEWMTEAMTARARTLIDRIIRADLSKYNCSPSVPAGWLEAKFPVAKGKVRVLLVDQTKGDASVTLGCASERSFEKMLADAREMFPGAAFFVKTHPDVVAGKKSGYLTGSLAQDVIVLAEDAAPLSLIAQFDEVFVVTSQMGLEALLLGKPVHVYGAPFYAGWGLTDDRCDETSWKARRGKKVPIEALFTAAYIRRSRYVEPFHGEHIEIEDAVDILEMQRRTNEANRGHFVATGIRRWKKPHFRAFFSGTGSKIDFVWDFEEALAAAKSEQAKLVIWAAKCTDHEVNRAAESGVELVRVEDGFIRSIGLGSDYMPPYSLVTDASGIYYDPARPSELEQILNRIAVEPDRYARECERAAKLREFIVAHGITKYNLPKQSQAVLPKFPSDRKVILVTGQVDGDASVRRGGGDIQSNRELLTKVREQHPGAYLIYLEHPDVASGNRPGAMTEDEKKALCDLSLSGVPVTEFCSRIDELHTLTSLSGFEALMRGVPVATWGRPFYAGWGLTKDALDFPQRRKGLSLNGLIAGTLMLYPRCWDWKSGAFCRPEDVCRFICAGEQPEPELWVKAVRQFRDFKKKFA
ncbi:capsular polysaccharide biosynthesis protein [Sutterella sp.]|uniref:capsular polysaccharide biosynthesis protein n=1 Tax=Sutterella sp. TaxID=1981025 RepID=UPI0026E1025B|nr:capsular polysaccharide biosynthesis protein [Sutterella sp.]MDO5531768.1 capsular polysaccharide biosynthesis protein [Sutterella sp.]